MQTDELADLFEQETESELTYSLNECHYFSMYWVCSQTLAYYGAPGVRVFIR